MNPALDAEIAAIEAELDGFFGPDGVKKGAAPAAKRPAEPAQKQEGPAPAAQRLDAEIAAIKAEMEGLFVPEGVNTVGMEPAQKQGWGRGLLLMLILVVAAGTAYFAYDLWSARTTPLEEPRVVKAPEVTGGRITEVAASEPPAATVTAPPSAPTAAPVAPPSRPQPIAVQRPPARAVVPTVAPAPAPVPVAVPAAPQSATAAPAQSGRTPVTHTRSAPAAAAPEPATVPASPAREPVQGSRAVCSPERAALGFCIENRTGEVR